MINTTFVTNHAVLWPVNNKLNTFKQATQCKQVFCLYYNDVSILLEIQVFPITQNGAVWLPQ